jgi:hypothetical protein
MKSLKSAGATPAARLFKGGTEVCEVLAFHTMDSAERAVADPPRIPATCCFNVPRHASVVCDESNVYELVFDNGARFPIRIRRVVIRAGDGPPEQNISAELI